MSTFQKKAMPIKSNMPISEASLIMLNLGAGMDIPTGSFLPGKYGERILNGGLGVVTGVTGKGNNFKTTCDEWFMARAAARYSTEIETDITTYETEENKNHHRVTSLYQQEYEFAERDLFEEGVYTITGKSSAFGDKWWAGIKDYLDNKSKNRKEILLETPFMASDKKSLVRIAQPTFSLMDSFSEFETSDIAKIMDDNELGDAGGNTIYMRQNLSKNRFLMEYPRYGVSNQHYLLTTTHFGKEIQMAAGPYAPPPEKKMNSMKPGEKVKGAPDKYFYLTHWLIHLSGSAILKTKDGTVEYPRDTDDKRVGDTDLWLVPGNFLRNKTGPSSVQIELIVSQSEGVQPSLTEFHMLRKSRWGLVGNDMNYVNALLPEEKLSRSVIRRKLASSAPLRRATNIASELYQMSLYHKHGRSNIVTPEELYAKIKEKGYNWDMILNKTRGWWKPNNERHPLLFLSTQDLLNMADGTYHPYWLEADKQTIKPQFVVEGEYFFA